MDKNKEKVDPEFECEYQDEMRCPYCGEAQSDSWESAPEDECGEASCGHCGKEFDVAVNREVTYSTCCKKDEHDYKVDNWHIEDMMTCVRCGDSKFTRFNK